MGTHTKNTKRTRGWAHVGTGAAIGALGVTMISGVSYAAPADIPDHKGELKLCFNKADAKNKDGGAVLSIFNPGENEKKCAPGDRRIEVNQRGPRGATGATGATGETGPSQIPTSAVSLGGLPGIVNQNPAPVRRFFPAGNISGDLVGGFASTQTALSISGFTLTRSTVNNALNSAATYNLVVDTDGPNTGSGQTSYPCSAAALAPTCSIGGTINIPAGATYWFEVPAGGGFGPGGYFSYFLSIA